MATRNYMMPDVSFGSQENADSSRQNLRRPREKKRVSSIKRLSENVRTRARKQKQNFIARSQRSKRNKALKMKKKDVPPKKGKRRALMIGINYSEQTNAKKLRLPPITYDSEDELFGCIDDSDTLTAILTKTGWKTENMRIMTDEAKMAHLRPTRKNILESLRWLVADAKPGDVFFLSFSGHGAQDRDPTGLEEDGLNETILPLDYEVNGDITDDQLYDILVRNLPDGCRLFALIDACHSGSMLDLPYELRGRRRWKEDVNPNFSRGDVQLLAGCRDYEKSSDGDYGGAMTQAFVKVLKRNPQGMTYPELLADIHLELRNGKFHQRPMITSSQKFDPNRLFVIDDIMPNHNEKIGRVVRKRFKAPSQNNALWKCIRFAAGFLIPFGLCVGIGLALAIPLKLGYPVIVAFSVAGTILGLIVGLQCLSENVYARVRLHFLRFNDKLFPPKHDKPKEKPVLYLGGQK